jgi:glycosyltransferase involved in cell wall biosynthesis
MTKEPLVSFVMPVYNAEEYLVESVYSVLNQTYNNIELVAINDGSKDSSKKILEEIAAKDDRLTVINQENTGIVGALNNGIAHAKGDYIARVDADDICFLRRIEKQLPHLLDDPEVVLVCSGFEVIDENSEFMYREIVPTQDEDIKRAMLLFNPIGHGTVLLRKAAVIELGGYSADCGPTEDYELWTRLSKVGKFVGIEDLLYRWRQNRNGITFTNNPAMQHHTKINLENFWKSSDIRPMNRREIMQTGKYYLDNSLRYGPDTKNIVYSNIGQVAAKLIKHGRTRDGLMQLLALASTGRRGLHYAWFRIYIILKSRITKTNP